MKVSPTSYRFPSLGTNILVSTQLSDTLSSFSVKPSFTCSTLYRVHPDHYAITRTYFTMFLQEADFNPSNYTVS
jgi:hypothetical protein